jgi:hypothetical protein
MLYVNLSACLNAPRTTTRDGNRTRKAMGDNNSRSVFGWILCIQLGWCSCLSAAPIAEVSAESDYYRQRADGENYVFANTIDQFEGISDYKLALRKLHDIAREKKSWVIFQKLLPSSGIFQVAIAYEDKDTIRSFETTSEGQKLFKHGKISVSKYNDIFDEAPLHDKALNYFEITDPVVYYITLKKANGSIEYIAMTNPGFRNAKTKSDHGISFDVNVSEEYLQLSTFVIKTAEKFGLK